MLLWELVTQVQVLESHQEGNNRAQTDTAVHPQSFSWEVSSLLLNLSTD